MKLVARYLPKEGKKNQDGCFTNDEDIKLYNNRKKNKFQKFEVQKISKKTK